MKRSFADILGDVAALQRKKVEVKLPGWADVDGLEFPDALCLEQCSGTAAAMPCSTCRAKTLSRSSARPMR